MQILFLWLVLSLLTLISSLRSPLTSHWCSTVQQAAEGRADEINTCIACNQACLDHTFRGQRASCLVNPFAGYELKYKDKLTPTLRPKKLAIVGAGPAGLACATTAGTSSNSFLSHHAIAERGHDVTLFDAQSEIGGQVNQECELMF